MPQTPDQNKNPPPNTIHSIGENNEWAIALYSFIITSKSQMFANPWLDWEIKPVEE